MTTDFAGRKKVAPNWMKEKTVSVVRGALPLRATMYFDRCSHLSYNIALILTVLTTESTEKNLISSITSSNSVVMVFQRE